VSIRRRSLIGAASVVGAAALVESISLAGVFDHRVTARVAESSLWRSTFMRFERLGVNVNGVGYVGHSTNVIVVNGIRVLTDPWFYDPARGSLVHRVGPAALPEDIGPLDAICISNNRGDSFDRRALDQMDKSAHVLVPTEPMARSVRRLGYSKVQVLEPWEELRLDKAVITGVPSLLDTEAMGIVVGGDPPAHPIYFSGPTALGDVMREVAERLAPKLAILPVDGSRTWPKRRWVMDPDEAIEATRRLKTRKVMPCNDDAAYSDYLVAYFLGRKVHKAREVFARKAAQQLKDVICYLPRSGDFVRA
jgi:L-ascorbate metabolism protein UlaG (beta-lactamase superfamily)